MAHGFSLFHDPPHMFPVKYPKKIPVFLRVYVLPGKRTEILNGLVHRKAASPFRIKNPPALSCPNAEFHKFIKNPGKEGRAFFLPLCIHNNAAVRFSII